MLPYNSPYAALTSAVTSNGGMDTSTSVIEAPADQASPQRPGAARISTTQGENSIPVGGILGPAVYAAGDADAGESFSPDDMRADEPQATEPQSQSAYPIPSQGGYELPAGHGFINEPYVAPPLSGIPPPRPSPLLMGDLQPSAGLVEYPPGSKAYYILECLPCYKAFNSAAQALHHIQTTPAHAEVKDVIGEEEAVEICGCRVVDATEEDFARIGRSCCVYFLATRKALGEDLPLPVQFPSGHSCILGLGLIPFPFQIYVLGGWVWTSFALGGHGEQQRERVNLKFRGVLQSWDLLFLG
ncbi:hypothetical protein VTL71DRAFT_627 [Oculimacula yallundae]|uniref:C2H2-type domain-containing protein n=1 Tax=Oculimacula yallundae TaxID=86028 RepID=A0ABR4D0K7_9HELO